VSEVHSNTRLEAFCDGVFAIALTLLIIDVRLPDAGSIRTSAELSRALLHLAPTVLAFLLSFVVILITWVNHHATLDLVHKSSASFVYANGLLLLTVVFIPFPTSLLGTFVGTDHAAPAVVLYDAVLALQAIAWVAVTATAINSGLADDEDATSMLRVQKRNGYYALFLYGLLAVAALWFPLLVAVVTTATWIFWLTLGIRVKGSRA
jgi:TMEM175 potassium channel family protein